MTAAIDFDIDMFCWWELGTTDATAAREFYTELFNWSTVETPMSPEGVYTSLQLGGKNLAGLYQLNKKQQAHNIPAHWLSYICVKDVEVYTQKAEQLGARIVLPPFDVMDLGKMSIIEDATGATVALWQTFKSMGSLQTNQIGSVCWNELYTRDMARSREFYTKLLDWTVQEMVMNDHPYVIFKKGEKQVASMMEITAEMGEAPPHWLLYLAVENRDAVVAKAQSKGAQILYNSEDIPDVGRFAVIQDPQGAVLAVFEMNPSAR